LIGHVHNQLKLLSSHLRVLLLKLPLLGLLSARLLESVDLLLEVLVFQLEAKLVLLMILELSQLVLKLLVFNSEQLKLLEDCLFGHWHHERTHWREHHVGRETILMTIDHWEHWRHEGHSSHIGHEHLWLVQVVLLEDFRLLFLLHLLLLLLHLWFLRFYVFSLSLGNSFLNVLCRYLDLIFGFFWLLGLLCWSLLLRNFSLWLFFLGSFLVCLLVKFFLLLFLSLASFPLLKSLLLPFFLLSLFLLQLFFF